MLEVDYSARFADVIGSIDWDIELPIEWKDYFDQRGEIPTYAQDERQNQRLKVRTHGLLWFDQALPFCARTNDPVGIYTRDFSRHGTGFLSPFEIYPEECVRVALPTFWVKLQVVRARRITSRCFEVGCELIERHDPAVEVFDLNTLEPAA
ncbi:MAG: hypothetical protein AAGG48_01910 [Planctomycetota bacterium]